jgi:hypothetical protein
MLFGLTKFILPAVFIRIITSRHPLQGRYLYATFTISQELGMLPGAADEGAIYSVARWLQQH